MLTNRCCIETECRRIILFLFFLPIFCTGFAQEKKTTEVNYPSKSYSHWYFGAEYGIPFLFGDFTSFSADKTYIGSQFGGFAGYQINSWVGVEVSARTGYTKMGAKSYAVDYLLNSNGMTYYTKQDFTTWKYNDVYSKVHFTNLGLQMNINVNNFFGYNRGNRRWTVLLSPVVYAQRFTTELIDKSNENVLAGKKINDWNIGVGGDVSLRYKISRAFDVQLRTGIIWVNNNKMDGISTLIKSKDHFMTSAGLSLIWKVGKKGKDNALYASKREAAIQPVLIEKQPVDLPAVVCCQKDSVEKSKMKQEIASLNTQLQQAQTMAAKKEDSLPVLGFNELPPVYFKRGSAYLNITLYRNELQRIVHTLKKYPELKVILLGYADNTGNQYINQKISSQRAEALATYLKKEGIDSQRITMKGESIDTLTSGSNNYSMLARRVIIEIQK